MVVSIATLPETCATHLFSMSPGSHPAQGRRSIVGPRLRAERVLELIESLGLKLREVGANGGLKLRAVRGVLRS